MADGSQPYMSQHLRYRAAVHRQKVLLTVLEHSMTAFQRSFSYTFCRIVNALSSVLRSGRLGRIATKLALKMSLFEVKVRIDVNV